MATILTSSGWMTNFIYEQDLTSYYMNNMLTGVFRPGIYNANIALVIDSSDNVYVSIKKGTTLLFSNSYIDNGDIGIRRNFSGMDTFAYNPATMTEEESLVLIKCVAQNDILQKIATLNDLKRLTKDSNVFLFAYMEYKKQAKESGFKVPVFRLAVKNDIGDSSRPGQEAGTSTDNYFYKTIKWYYKYDGEFVQSTDESEEWILPDGCIEYSINTSTGTQKTRKLSEYSFLMLGVISSISEDSNVSNGLYKKTLSFSGRGLPEYRHQMTNESNDMSSDIIFDLYPSSDTRYQSVYIDLVNTLFSNSLVNKRILNSTDFCDYGWEYPYLENNIAEVNSNKYQYSSIESLGDILNSNTPVVVATFIFGGLDTTTVGTDDISDIFTGNDINLSYFSVNVKASGINTAKLKYSNDTNAYWSASKYFAVPLDISMWNINRLASLISNVNVWSKVLDNYRNSELTEDSGTDLFPIAVSFKMVTKNENSGEGTTVSDGDYYFENGLDGISRANPVNTLCYFDLKNKKCFNNVIDFSLQNAFNQIPIK